MVAPVNCNLEQESVYLKACSHLSLWTQGLTAFTLQTLPQHMIGLIRSPYLLPFFWEMTASNQVRKRWRRLAWRVQGDLDLLINNAGSKEAYFKCVEIKTNRPLPSEEDQIKKYSRNLDMCNSTGPELAEVTARPLSIISEWLGWLEDVPDDWSKANVTLIYQKGRKEDPGK